MASCFRFMMAEAKQVQSEPDSMHAHAVRRGPAGTLAADAAKWLKGAGKAHASWRSLQLLQGLAPHGGVLALDVDLWCGCGA